MSSYVYKKAIRYKLPKDKAKDYMDNHFLDDSYPESLGLPERFEFDFAYNGGDGDEGDRHDVYLDKVYEKLYDEVSGDFEKSRMLTDKEIACHLEDFWKYDKNILPKDLRAVEYCYYNGVDGPNVFEVTEDEQEGWLF